MVPNDGCRMKPDVVAEVLQLPAHVDVVAGGPVDRVESSNLSERLAPERHIAARYVFCTFVIQEHVNWSTWGPGHALRNRRILRWRQVRTTGAGRTRGLQREYQIGEPVLISPGV